MHRGFSQFNIVLIGWAIVLPAHDPRIIIEISKDLSIIIDL